MNRRTHTPFPGTLEQQANLEKLRDYLAALPAEYDRFGMSVFYLNAKGWAEDRPAKTPTVRCGAVACAIGHGPAAGIKVPLGVTSWHEYASQTMGGGPFTGTVWQWCFDGAWYLTDNTPHGAAARIGYMLTYGVPSDAVEQQQGAAPLCYEPYIGSARKHVARVNRAVQLCRDEFDPQQVQIPEAPDVEAVEGGCWVEARVWVSDDE